MKLPVKLGLAAVLSLPIWAGSPSGDDSIAASFGGVLRPDRTVHVSAASDGLLAAVHVDRGDRVTVGQPIAELDRTVELASLRLAEARRDDASELESARARAEDARRRKERAASLRKDGITTEDEFLRAQLASALEDLALKRAEAGQEIASLEAHRAAALAERGVVKSPVDGFVLERYLSPGELLTRSGQDRVVTVVDFDPLRVEIHVPVELFGKIAVGTQATVTPQHFGAEPRMATVSDLAPVVDTASSTFRVRLLLPNPDFDLPAGAHCSVQLHH